MIALWLAMACSGEDVPSTTTPLNSGAAELARPDLSGIDLDAAFDRALALALDVTPSPIWDGNRTVLGVGRSNCPDLYVGPPEDDDAVDEDASGLHWSDRCETAGGLYFLGWNWWDGSLTASGDEDSAEGRTVDGTRLIVGSAAVGDNSGVRFRFDGTAEDALHQVTAQDYERWTYTSLVDGRLDGRDTPTESGTQSGWRADLYLQASGGNEDQLELRGNLYLNDERIADRFDSLAADFLLQGELGAAPGECTLEPKGWISLRDENAWWYDVVFQPRTADLADTGQIDGDYSACDGCGTLYVRGLEEESWGQVCPDFQAIWDRGVVARPTDTDFIFTLRDLVTGAL
jgi:hypothetical protein